MAWRSYYVNCEKIYGIDEEEKDVVLKKSLVTLASITSEIYEDNNNIKSSTDLILHSLNLVAGNL